MKDVMFDSETLSLKANPLFLSIGAVIFDRNGTDTMDSIAAGTTPWDRTTNTDRRFYRVIKMDDQVEKFGRHIDPDTVMWWMRQDAQAQAALFAPTVERVRLDVALMEFAAWVSRVGGEKLWSNGASDDVVWLKTAFDAINVKFPFHYRGPRDLRTIVDLAGEGVEELKIKGLIPHHALHDAIYQTIFLQSCMKRIGGKNVQEIIVPDRAPVTACA